MSSRVVVVLVLGLMMVSAPLAPLLVPGVLVSAGAPDTAVPEANIAFHSDAALAVLSGSGTADDPYLIENRNFDSDLGNGRSALFIEQTTKHVLIRNCTFSGANSFEVGLSMDNQISLINVQNVTISNCTVIGDSTNYNGIYINIGENIDINNCTITLNSCGVRTYSSHLINISDCEILENDWSGVFTESCSLVSIQRCEVRETDGGSSAIQIGSGCSFINVDRCAFSGVGSQGSISSSNNVTFSNCTGHGKTYGYSFYSSTDVAIDNNLIENITYSPIGGSGSRNVAITNNIILNSTSTYKSPIEVYTSNWVMVAGNTINSSAYHGMYFSGINGLMIDHNTITNTSGYGISPDHTLTNVIISNNTIAYTDLMGISDFSDSSNILIENNYFHDLDASALNIWGASHVMVTGNVFENLPAGFFLSDGDNVTVAHNLIRSYTLFPFHCQSEENYSIYLNAFDSSAGLGSSSMAGSNNVRMDNGTFGNYYGWLALPDVNKDGIADTSVILPASSATVIDHFPLAGWAAPVTGLVADNSSNRILLNWNAPNYTVAPEVDHYIVYRTGGAGPFAWQVPSASSLDLSAEYGVTYSYMVRACTAWGDGPFCDPINVVLETSPELTITLPTEGYIVGASSFSITWTATDASGLSYYQYSIDGEPWTMTYSSGAGSGYRADGAHSLSVRAYNNIGRFTEETVNFRVDAQGPVVTITSPVDGKAYSSTTSHLSFTAYDVGSEVILGNMYYDWGSGPVTWTSSFEVDLGTLAPGTYSLTVHVGDHSGWMGSDTVSFTIDTTAPLLEITQPREGQIINTPTYTVSWGASDPDSSIAWTEVKVDDAGWVNQSQAVSANIPLSDGEHNIRVRTWNAAGLSTMAEVNVTVDATVPSLTVTFPAYGGSYNVTSLTAHWSGSDAGTGLDYYDYRLDDGGWSVPTIGTSFLLDGLEEGPHTFYVRMFDNASNSVTVSVPFIIDLTSPAVTLAPFEGELINTVDVNVVVTATDTLSGVKNYTYWMDGVEFLSITGSHAFTGLADGLHHLVVKVYDNAGNAAWGYANFTIDTQLPTLTVDEPSEEEVFDHSDVTISWSGADVGTGVSRYETSLDGANWVSRSLSSSVTLTGLTDGEHTVSVRVLDNASNSLTVSVNFLVDVGSPTVVIVNLEEGSYMNSMPATVKAIGVDAASSTLKYQFRVDGGAWTANSTSNTTSLPALTDGAHNIKVRAWDLAGHSVMDQVNFTLDTTVPVITISSPGNNTRTNSSTITIGWDATDINIVHFLLRVDSGDWLYVNGANVSAVVNELEDGHHTIDVKAVDRAGNVAVASVVVLIDTVEPTIEGTPEGTGVSIDADIVVRFSEVMNTTSVRAYLNGIEKDLSWNGHNATLDIAKLLPGTEYTVLVTGADLAGNGIASSWTFSTTDQGTLTGKIVDANGNPISGAVVTLDTGETATTGADGTFTMVAKMGAHNLTVTKDGFVVSTKQVTVEGGASTVVESIALSASSKGSDMTIILVIAALAAVALIGALLVVKRRKV